MFRNAVDANGSHDGQSGPTSLVDEPATIWATCAPNIEVSTDPTHRLVRAALSGMLALDDVDLFYRSELDAVRANGWRSGEFLLLVETRGNVVQSREVMEAFQSLIQHSPVKAKRIAIVRAGALPAMQTRRIAKARESVEVFATVEEAEVWLFQDEAKPS